MTKQTTILTVMFLMIFASLGHAEIFVWKQTEQYNYSIFGLASLFLVFDDDGSTYSTDPDNEPGYSHSRIILTTMSRIRLNDQENATLRCAGGSIPDITTQISKSNFEINTSEGPKSDLIAYSIPDVSGLGPGCVLNETNSNKFVLGVLIPTSTLIDPYTPEQQRKDTFNMINTNINEYFEMRINEIKMVWIIIQVIVFLFAFIYIPGTICLFIIWVVKKTLRRKKP